MVVRTNHSLFVCVVFRKSGRCLQEFTQSCSIDAPNDPPVRTDRSMHTSIHTCRQAGRHRTTQTVGTSNILCKKSNIQNSNTAANEHTTIRTHTKLHSLIRTAQSPLRRVPATKIHRPGDSVASAPCSAAGAENRARLRNAANHQ